jgi:hypothetical protein
LALTSPEKKQVALGFFLATAFKRASVVAILGALYEMKRKGFVFFTAELLAPTPG